MATSYLTPGVYMEEVDRGPKPIEGVGTSLAAFIGYAEQGPVGQPVYLSNWTQFSNTFGSFMPGGYLAHAVYGFFTNGGTACYVSRLPNPDGDTTEGPPAARAALPSRGNSGVPALEFTAVEPGSEITVEVALPPPPADGNAGPTEEQFTIAIRGGSASEVFEGLSMRKGRGSKNAVETINAESKLVRVAEREAAGTLAERMPAPGSYALSAVATSTSTALATISSGDLVGDAAERTGVNGMEVAEDANILAFPDLMALYQAGRIDMEGVKAVQTAMLDHCANMRNRVAILDCPPGLKPQEIRDWRMVEMNYDSKYAALYYPWVRVANPLGNGSGVFVPPSGHMAGVWARTDGARGVHKAPANEIVMGAIGLEYQTTKGEQEILNPVGINCIRSFPGRGIRVWGARTISSDPAWRYLNVRRLFNFVESSIENGTQWVVFEPNDLDLWERVKRDVSAFLGRVWRSGALFGATAEQAFYVKCDEELNPVEVRDVGQLVVEIGIAPVKPAEFVIFRISQWQGE